MVQGAVTTSAPSYVTGQINALSLNTSGGLRVDGSGATQPVSGTFWQTTQPVSIAAAVTVAQPTAANLNATVVGSVSITGTAAVSGTVTANQGGAPWRSVGALRSAKGVQKTSITVNTETTVVTAGAGFNDVYAIVVTNKSATGVSVDFRDATAGTVRMTLAAPANDTRGFTVAVDSAMIQAVAANNWTATVSAAVTSIEITMLYVGN
jgi:hypothetical protein